MEESFTQLINEYEKLYFKFFPEEALLLGRTDASLDRFYDNSPASIQKWEEVQDHIITKLNNIDLCSINKHQKITFNLLKDQLESSKATRICKQHLWNISPPVGWHTKITRLAELQPLNTEEERRQALTRWKMFGQFIDQEINNLQQGLTTKFTAPKPIVQRVINQLSDLIFEEVKASPFFCMVQHAENEEFRQEMTKLIKTIINPALQKYKDYLMSYLPNARDAIGVNALPSGDQGYLVNIKAWTTLDISPEAICQLGKEHMQVIEKEVAEIGKRLYDKTTMKEIFKSAIQDPLNLFSNEIDLLKYNSEALERAKQKAPYWFDKMPIAEGVIRPYPLYLAKAGASGEYHAPSEDGKEPGFFYINTFEAEKIDCVSHEATLFHELIPGHHFQIALQQEDKDILSLNKYLWNSGYGEGWALYVERLADEMKLYSSDVARLGMLANEALRTARLVVDTGIHKYGWERQEAIDYMKTHTTFSDLLIEAEVDRYIMMPGQATSYILGKFEIEALRDFAKNELGKHFDIREFHNQVLKNGVVTLPMLANQIKHWVEEEKKIKV